MDVYKGDWEICVHSKTTTCDTLAFFEVFTGGGSHNSVQSAEPRILQGNTIAPIAYLS